MACSWKTGVSVSGVNENLRFFSLKSSGVSGFSYVSVSAANRPAFPVLTVDFLGKSEVITSDQNGSKALNGQTIKAHPSICVCRALRWWDKSLKPNMVEIRSAQALVDALIDAGDRLVIVNFYGPGCGGCRTVHPKICQLAESYPDAIFLQVNFEELRNMSQALHVRVLPFFKLYRGAEGHLCSFSCTNATIKKLKDALAKFGTDIQSSPVPLPAKGLDEDELERLVSAGELPPRSPSPDPNEGTVSMMRDIDSFGSWGKKMALVEDSLVLKA